MLSLQAGGGKRFVFAENRLQTTTAQTCFHLIAGVLESPVIAFNYAEGGTNTFVLAGLNGVAIGNVSLGPAVGDLSMTSGMPTPTLIGNTFTGASAALAPSILYAAAAPATGTWKQGDVVYNTNPLPGSSVGWICTAAGSPGTWKTFGAIDM